MFGDRPSDHIAHAIRHRRGHGLPQRRGAGNDSQQFDRLLIGVHDHARRIRDSDDVVDVVNRVDEGGLPLAGHGTIRR
ncbi:MAG: hypothetical protein IPO52_11840 [Gemmatimonadetes bacterium]|nr:hypothetical protein [Gemmatimonadota bacterium]